MQKRDIFRFVEDMMNRIGIMLEGVRGREMLLWEFTAEAKKQQD